MGRSGSRAGQHPQIIPPATTSSTTSIPQVSLELSHLLLCAPHPNNRWVSTPPRGRGVLQPPVATSPHCPQCTFVLPVVIVIHDVVVVEAIVEGVVGATGQVQQGGLQEEWEQQHGWEVRLNPEPGLQRGKDCCDIPK